MWFSHGALRPRPGLRRITAQPDGEIVEVYPRNGAQTLLMSVTENGKTTAVYGVYAVTSTAVFVFDGTAFTRVPDSVTWDAGGSPVYGYGEYDFSNGCAVLPAAETDAAGQSAGALSVTGKTVYLFGGGSFFAVGPRIVTGPSGQNTAVLMAWKNEPYVPVLFEDCPPAGGGAAFEARNLLTPNAGQLFTTDSASTVYRLNETGLDDAEVVVDYDPIASEAVRFSFAQGQVSASSGGLSATLDRTAGKITFSAALVDAGALKFKNNLRVTYSKTVTLSPPVARCTSGVWFGDIGSKNGGNRLFVSGDPENPNRVYYSAADNPWYFPQDGFVAAGDPDDPVTALGRHYDVLVVFKTGSLYALDFASSSISVRLINSRCGCDMPRSVQLIENRLVWAHSKLGVLILFSTGIENEKSVGVLSRRVNSLFLNFAGPGGAPSVNDGERYFLFCWDRVFVWQYSLAANETDTIVKTLENASWVEWDLPFGVNNAYLNDGILYMSDVSGTFYRFDESIGFDAFDAAGNKNWFDAWWYSKAENFGEPGKSKNHAAVYAEFENAGPANLVLSAGLDGREDHRAIRLLKDADTDALCETLVPGARRFDRLRAGVRRLPQDFSVFGLKKFSVKCLGRP